jgi:predicted phosphoribosyltransferase
VFVDMTPFADRRDAGRVLAERLSKYAGRSDVVVLALPRGGVPVAYEVATLLGAPLDVLIVRKIGAPFNEEFAVGAIASGHTLVLDKTLLKDLKISEQEIDKIIAAERLELQRREHLYRDSRPFPALDGKTVILVDDGLATGATMVAAVRAMRTHDPAQVVVAVPVAQPETCEMLKLEAGECVCAITPSRLYGVGAWYHDFSQTSDEEVRTLLARAAEQRTTFPSSVKTG